MRVPIQRITRSGWEMFIRDRSSSGAALVIMTVVISVATFLFVANGFTSFLVATLEESVDISAYLKDSAPEERVTNLQEELLTFPEVREVQYISKEDALEKFEDTHKNDDLIVNSLAAVGTNPLLASLNIKAESAEQYSIIARFLERDALSALVSEVDYHDRAPVIARLGSLVKGIQFGMIAVMTGLMLTTILVAFNTIRLTIYQSRNEVEVMKLVGAENWYVRGPFIVQGIIVGIAGSVISMLLFVPLTYVVSVPVESLLPGFNPFNYFVSN
ncbi:MAG: ABC transporter permease, partial [archaeon]|nr:ABC transporter permease [archaeon]